MDRQREAHIDKQIDKGGTWTDKGGTQEGHKRDTDRTDHGQTQEGHKRDTSRLIDKQLGDNRHTMDTQCTNDKHGKDKTQRIYE